MTIHHKLHPLCSIFPPMSDEEFERLRDDIAKHGQRQPILLFDGQILDGRHRHDACLLLKIEPKFETFHGTFDEAEALVLSLNLARRHLDTSQRMNIAAKLATLPRGTNRFTKVDAQICASTMTQQEAAKKLNVSTRGVQAAKYVNEHAAPEVIAEVDAGRMSINKAKKLIAALPDKGRQALAVKADAVDEMIAAHAAELQAAEAREAAEAKPAWLADPDEMGMPDVDAMPPLPRTNTHHTSENRRTPDARETDRVGIVPPDDPRSYHDGHWYEWSEDRGRMVAVTDEEILRRADQIRGQSIVEPAATTTPVVEHKTACVSSKRFIPPTADEVSAYSDEINAGVDGQQFVDFYESKGWMIGKNKMKDWRAAVRTWKRSEGQRGSKISTAVRSNRNWDEEIPEWKPTE